MRYLGIDYGTKHIGFALGDDESRMALPLKTLTSTPDLLKDIQTLITHDEVEMIVVGLPEQGTDRTAQRDITRAFVEELKAHTTLPVVTVDESFSSKEAAVRLREVGGGKDDHAVAAMLILQTYFDTPR